MNFSKYELHSSLLRTFLLRFLSQEKRSIFPRFYFIGDDDLLEILGQATNPAVIQSHLKKLFAGIHSVQFDEANQHILAMRSLDGELVPLTKKIRITTSVEEWLKELSKEMISTLQQLLNQALQESRKQLGQIPVEKYPSQVNARFLHQTSHAEGLSRFYAWPSRLYLPIDVRMRSKTDSSTNSITIFSKSWRNTRPCRSTRSPPKAW